MRPFLVAGWISLAAVASGFAQRPGDGPPRGGARGARPPERVHLLVAPQGNEARYRVREQLANFDFPTDAVGLTRAVTGGILVDDQGMIVPDSSRFVVDLTTLASDEARRDRFLQRNTLKTDSFPELVFVPTGIKELPRAPTSVPASFQLTGNLTLRGVTRPVTWDVTVKQAGRDVAGSASTSFAFADFGLPVPRLALLLSVKDTIRLDYDFHLVRSP